MPKLFESYAAAFFSMTLYMGLTVVTLLQALLNECGCCGRHTGIKGILSKKCGKCKKKIEDCVHQRDAMKLACVPHAEPPERNWDEYEHRRKLLFLFALLTFPFIMGATMLLPLIGLDSHRYSPFVY